MFKRLAAIILSLALLLSVVGTASANVIDPALVPEETGEITVYMYGDKTPRMQELCANEYAKVFLEEINCVVNIEYISWSEYGSGELLLTDIPTGMKAATGYDVATGAWDTAEIQNGTW